MTSLSQQPSLLIADARACLGGWVDVQHHRWRSLYCWQSTPIYDAFGESIGRLEADTIYLDVQSSCPEQDLFHELGHAIARRFNLIGHRGNGFLGAWELRQRRLIGGVGHQRHWSRLLERVRRTAPPYTPELCSEIWAELFMCWYLFPGRRETVYIAEEMTRLETRPELQSIDALSRRVMAAETTKQCR